MTVTVKPGKAWINGYVYINTDNLILNVDVADGVLNRIDRVVIKLDFLNREIKTIIKEGTFASNPVSPELQRDADAYELGVADIYIGKGAISITQSNITDLRMNTNLCGWVNSLIQADTTAIFNQYMDWYNSKKNDYEGWYSSTTNQYQTDMSNMELQFQNIFNTWFDTVKNTLGADVAGNLLNQINSIAGEGRTNETVKGNADIIKRLDEKVGSHLAENATLTTKGHVQLNSATNSTDETTAVTPKAVKSAYDLANGAISKSLLTTAGDIIYASAANTPTRLAKGTDGQALVLSGGKPAWGDSFPSFSPGNLLIYYDVQVSIINSYQNSWTESYNFRMPTNGGIRLSYTAQSPTNYDHYLCWFVNDSPKGIQRNLVKDGAEHIYTEDITGLKAGDKVSLYYMFGGGNSAYRNIKIGVAQSLTITREVL